MPNELKPCPFCGNVTHLKVMTCCDDSCDQNVCTHCRSNPTFTICCDAVRGGCGAICGYKETKEKAIEAWNRRATNG